MKDVCVLRGPGIRSISLHFLNEKYLLLVKCRGRRRTRRLVYSPGRENSEDKHYGLVGQDLREPSFGSN